MFKRVRSTNGDLIAFSHIRTGLASPNAGNQPVLVVSGRTPPHVQVMLPVAQGASGGTVLERVRCTFGDLIAFSHIRTGLASPNAGNQPVQVVLARTLPHIQVMLPVAQGASGETCLQRVRCTFGDLIAFSHIRTGVASPNAGNQLCRWCW